MINGLDRINYDQLTGLVAVKATSIETDDISYDEIYTLNDIDTSKTIQTQLDDLQTVLSEIGTISISGTTLSGIIFKPYLEQYYYNKSEVDGKVSSTYNTIMDSISTNY